MKKKQGNPRLGLNRNIESGNDGVSANGCAKRTL
jgi:hypothetical protein